MINEIRVFFILILVSLNSFSEEYACSINLSQVGQTGMQIKTYKRIDGAFLKTDQFGESIFEIAKETEEFIILNQTYYYSSIYTVYLDKKNNELIEDYISFSTPDELIRVKGECLIKKSKYE